MNAMRGIFRDSRGVTLVEVMMAVAVLGIMIVFITQMTGTGSRITADNLDQTRMMELARAEMERLKADYREEGYASLPLDGYYVVDLEYPPGATAGDIEQKYAIMYENEEYNGYIMKIVVGPLSGGPPSPDDYDSYVLVAWLPE